jgi:hypothetical protein
MLTDGQVEALYESGVDPAAKESQHGIDGLQSTKHHAVLYPHQASAPHRLHHLRIGELRQRHPTRLGVWPFVFATWRLHPLAEMGEERCGILREAVGQEERHTAGRQHLNDLVDYALRHGQRPVLNVDGQEQLGDRIDRRPYPLSSPWRLTLYTVYCATYIVTSSWTMSFLSDSSFCASKIATGSPGMPRTYSA